jgi:nucleotidyltransferase/DNA polymerase involved in DNA repair
MAAARGVEERHMSNRLESVAADPRHYWAFAVDTAGRTRRSRKVNGTPQRYLNRYAITACSPKAKQLGVQAGMRFSEARKLVPGLRVIVTNR